MLVLPEPEAVKSGKREVKVIGCESDMKLRRLESSVIEPWCAASKHTQLRD